MIQMGVLICFLKQVLDFFSYLIRSLGNNIQFVVSPTLHDGMNVGISWRLGKHHDHKKMEYKLYNMDMEF